MKKIDWILILIFFLYNIFFQAFFSLGSNDIIVNYYTMSENIASMGTFPKIVFICEVLSFLFIYVLNGYYRKTLNIAKTRPVIFKRTVNDAVFITLVIFGLFIFNFAALAISDFLQTYLAKPTIFDNFVLPVVYFLNPWRKVAIFLMKFLYYFGSFYVFSLILRGNVFSILYWIFGKKYIVPKKLIKNGRLIELDEFIENLELFLSNENEEIPEERLIESLQKLEQIVEESDMYDKGYFYVLLKFISLLIRHDTTNQKVTTEIEEVIDRFEISNMNDENLGSLFSMFSMNLMTDNDEEVHLMDIVTYYNSLKEKRNDVKDFSKRREFVFSGVLYQLLISYMTERYDISYNLLEVIHRYFYELFDEFTFSKTDYPYMYLRKIIQLQEDLLLIELPEELSKYEDSYPEVRIFIKAYGNLMSEYLTGGVV
ncbi:MAG TPA: hypothetical protein PKW84_06625 [Fervidobacterium sp.]|nr:hypothetical protein [Fervidobacterium sp.]HQO05777.1 hypothetical protein [Fervidobacterium sp.]